MPFHFEGTYNQLFGTKEDSYIATSSPIWVVRYLWLGSDNDSLFILHVMVMYNLHFVQMRASENAANGIGYDTHVHAGDVKFCGFPRSPTRKGLVR